MKCSVARCSRASTVKVYFFATGATHHYCGWHTFDRHGRQRWPESVAKVEKI